MDYWSLSSDGCKSVPWRTTVLLFPLSLRLPTAKIFDELQLSDEKKSFVKSSWRYAASESAHLFFIVMILFLSKRSKAHFIINRNKHKYSRPFKLATAGDAVLWAILFKWVDRNFSLRFFEKESSHSRRIQNKRMLSDEWYLPIDIVQLRVITLLFVFVCGHKLVQMLSSITFNRLSTPKINGARTRGLMCTNTGCPLKKWNGLLKKK